MHLPCASHKAGIRPQDRGFWNLFHYVNSSKKGLQNRHSYAIILVVPSQILGCRQAVRHQTLTLAFVGSNPAIPAKSDPLAQLAEQLPFKQWVRGSNPRRVTKQKEVIAFGGGLFSFRWSVKGNSNPFNQAASGSLEASGWTGLLHSVLESPAGHQKSASTFWACRFLLIHSSFFTLH